LPADAAGSGDMPAYYMMDADEAAIEPEVMSMEEIEPGPADPCGMEEYTEEEGWWAVGTGVYTGPDSAGRTVSFSWWIYEESMRSECSE